MLACTEVISKANDGDVDARQLLDLAEQKIYDIRQGKDASAMEKIDTVIIAAYDRLLKLTGENKEEYEGLRTGFSRLDMLTAGLNKSDLILIAARPGMGKSSFAMNMAINVAKRYKMCIRDRCAAIRELLKEPQQQYEGNRCKKAAKRQKTPAKEAAVGTQGAKEK